MPRFRLTIDTGFAGSTHTEEVEWDDAEWAALTEDARQIELDNACRDFLFERCEASAEEIKE